jgi:hypothetical protein
MKERVTTLSVGKQLSFMLFLFAFICGCEDVITVDLRGTESNIVIEGVISNYVSGHYFLITRTTDFYNPNVVERVTGATITVTDSLGNSTEFIGTAPGEYRPTSELGRVYGRTYYATVIIDGETYIASTTMPDPLRIDSLRTEYQEGGGIGTEEDEGYRLHVYFQDIADRPDYARIKLGVNGSYSEYYYLYDGRYSDGNVVDYEYFFDVFQPGDVLTVDLHTLDRAMYYYFLTLDEVWVRDEVGNFLDATPANPNTNWSGGALGYFATFEVSQKQTYVQESGQ